jgi:rhomboid family protein
VVWLPAWIVLAFWFVQNFLLGTEAALAIHRQNMGGVAFWAHVGGFVSGVLLVGLFGERRMRYPYAVR